MVRYFKFYILALLFLGATQWCTAQKGTTAAGGEATGTTGTVSFSVGLVDYVAYNNSSVSVNQGVQQAYEIFSVVSVKTPEPKFNLSLYPNPTTNFVVLSINSAYTQKLSYKLYDITGKQIALKAISSDTTNIPMSGLSAATYFVTVFNKKGVIKTYKIIKH